MKFTQYLRLAVYGIAALTGAVVAVVAAVQQNGPMLAVALGWIGTTVLAGANIDRTTEPPGDHAA